MLEKTTKAIADGLHRQMPVKEAHTGRGCNHSEECFTTCYDSWERCVNEMATVIFGYTSGNDRRWKFIARCKGTDTAIETVA